MEVFIMYQLFPSYGSFVVFTIVSTIIAILSVLFRPELNAIEDVVRDYIELKIQEKKAEKRRAKRKNVPQHAKNTTRKIVPVTSGKSGNMAA